MTGKFRSRSQDSRSEGTTFGTAKGGASGLEHIGPWQGAGDGTGLDGIACGQWHEARSGTDAGTACRIGSELTVT
jgi:hypothetical protein